MERCASKRVYVGRAVASRVLSCMLDQAADPNFSDLRVLVGGKVFPCHRAVLAASSPVFAAMCRSQMRETVSGELELVDVTPDAFAAVRNYLYGRPLLVHDDHALAVSAFVRRYEVDVNELPDYLDTLLTSALTLDNVLAVRDHADLHSAHRLRRNCDRFVTARMKMLPDTPSFLQSGVALASAALHAPCNVSRDAMSRRCAQDVLAAAVAWLLHDEAGREEHRDEVLATVDVFGLSLPALVRASRDEVALKSPSFQARLLRAFARKAERDLTFRPVASSAVADGEAGNAVGFAAVDEPAVLRHGYRALDDNDVCPCPQGHNRFHSRQWPTLSSSLVHPRFPQQYIPSSVEHQGSSTPSESDDW